MLDTGHLFDVKLFIIDVVFLKIEIYLINNDLLQNLNEVKCARQTFGCTQCRGSTVEALQTLHTPENMLCQLCCIEFFSLLHEVLEPFWSPSTELINNYH